MVYNADMLSVTLSRVIAALLLFSIWTGCVNDIASSLQEPDSSVVAFALDQDASDDERPCLPIAVDGQGWLVGVFMFRGDYDVSRMADPSLPPPPPPPESA